MLVLYRIQQCRIIMETNLSGCVLLVCCVRLQGTFTDDAVIVSMGLYCGNFDSDDTRAFLSVVYAYSKRALYTKPSSSHCRIYAATYLAPISWYRSVPPSGQALIEPSFKPFNSYIQPARPQDIEDMSKPPMLVMKVRNSLFVPALYIVSYAFCSSGGRW
jgi:hypothetical protein